MQHTLSDKLCDRAYTVISFRSVEKFNGLVGQSIFLMEQDFCFYYMFKINFPGQTILWGYKKHLGLLPPNAPPPVVTSLITMVTFHL